MIRSRWFGAVRWCYESIESVLFAGGWAARLAHFARLQGDVVATAHEVTVDDDGKLPGPLRIAFASDFHAGPLTDVRLLRDAIARMQAFDPHLILLGGDFVGLHSRHVRVFRDVVRTLAAPCGVFAVVGNHDLWKGEVAIRRALEEAGVAVLKNSSARLPPPFDAVVIGGLDDPAVGRPDADATFRTEEGIRVAVMHSPEGIVHVVDKSVVVAFAGHTHGGQICLPGGVPLVVPTGCWRWKKGRFAFEGIPGGMIVSRGVGCSTLPIRLACPSEVILCELKPS